MAATACQSPTSASSVGYDDAIDATATPEPIVATASTDGRTYRIVRGNNQPDDIATYDWHAVFSTTVAFNAKAMIKTSTSPSPCDCRRRRWSSSRRPAASSRPPTGADKEYYEFVTLNASNNQFSGVSAPNTLTFEVWNDLPCRRKEAVVSLTFSFVDENSKTFQKEADIKVAP